MIDEKLRLNPYPSGLKFCTGCGKKKPLSEYHKNRTAFGGVCHRCKECRKKNELARQDRKRKQGIKW